MNLRTFTVVLGILASIVTWSYFSTIAKAADRWQTDIQYSHGWLIPVFALYLLWHRRELLIGQSLEPSWWSMPFLMVAIALRWIEVRYSYNAPDALSMTPMFLGLFLAVGGWPAFRWGWPAALFLMFMVPLPYMLHTGMSTQLQALATTMSTFTLQTFGLPAVAEGTQIMINDGRVSVAEACSGLGMIVTFAALSTAVIMLVSSPWWVKVGLLLGALPVSLICNVVRISTVGAFKYAGFSLETVDTVHEVVGYLMILLGCGLIFVELYVLERIVIAQDGTRADDIPLPLPYGATFKPV